MKNRFFILWSAGIVATTAVLPYAFTLQHDTLAKVMQPYYIIVVASIAQTALLLAVAIFPGLKLSQSINLPVLGLTGSGEPALQKFRRVFSLAAPLGLATALAIALGDNIFSRFTPQITIAASHVAVWKTLLASLYGGVVEEILTRLFLVSLFAWILGKIFKPTDTTNSRIIMWTAITLAAILFGLGHLPITSSITQITPLIVARAIILNGIGGMAFGWLYWKKGLEYGMVAHFVADIMLLTVLPALLR